MTATAPTATEEAAPASSPETQTVAPAPPAPSTGSPSTGSKGLGHGGLLSQTALRKLRSQQEDFAHNLEARLSVNLRLELPISLAGIQTISFQKFVELAGTPLHFTLFKLDPLRGIGLLEIPPQLGLGIVNRLLGGAGALDNAARALTDIEAAVLDQVSSVILAEWAAPWSGLQELKPAILGHEIDARFLNAISRETMILEITFDAVVNETQGRFRIGLPYASFEPLIRRLSGESDPKQGGSVPAAVAAAPPWNPQLDDVSVKLTAICTGLNLNLQTLGTLKAGDMVPVDAQRFHHVEIRLGDLAKFVGTLGTSEGRWAIQLTGKLEA
ncbi:MAG TPA: FliM/FliN family flagellar motor switch protein [Verrucomicrobiae bacterium]|nr:FliM/FliN family flagellar motor switch protein [Verrucomicrobiae bacterium]